MQYECCIIVIPLSLGVGGWGLCVGEAELTHEMRAEANETKWNLTMPNEEEEGEALSKIPVLSQISNYVRRNEDDDICNISHHSL